MSLSFFEENKNKLQENYPGVNLRIFTNFIEDLGKLNLIFSTIKNDLLEGRPFEYILNRAHFYSIELYVDERVLIPRFETEGLFDLTSKHISQLDLKEISIIDVGCGPGTIILSLMNEHVNLKAVASDISDAAIEITLKNLENLKINLKTKQLEILKSDRLKQINQTFDIIVSNPPYIKTKQGASGVHKSVDKFEPKLALYIHDDDYNQWFEDLFTDCLLKLKPRGHCFIETHEDEISEQREVALRVGFTSVEILKDLTGTRRFLKMEK